MDLSYNERFDNDNNNNNSNYIVVSSGSSTIDMVMGGSFAIWFLLVLIIWFTGGVTAFIASLVCMFYNSTVSDKVVGFLLAFVFGPLYWGFYIYKANYCTKYQTVNYYYE